MPFLPSTDPLLLLSYDFDIPQSLELLTTAQLYIIIAGLNPLADRPTILRASELLQSRRAVAQRLGSPSSSEPKINGTKTPAVHISLKEAKEESGKKLTGLAALPRRPKFATGLPALRPPPCRYQPYPRRRSGRSESPPPPCPWGTFKNLSWHRDGQKKKKGGKARPRGQTERRRED